MISEPELLTDLILAAVHASKLTRQHLRRRPAMSTIAIGEIVLEPDAHGFADAVADPPFLSDLPPEEGPRRARRGPIRAMSPNQLLRC